METNKTPHSPGPWTVGTGWIKAANGRKVCADFPGIYRDDGESEANARLIAAAPDLLKTLETVAGELQVWLCSGDPRPAPWAGTRIKRIRAAIAKATAEGALI